MRDLPIFLIIQKRAFSLIETAIVLGVMGLVIGGIWVAAASVNDYFKWKQTEEGLMYYWEVINSYYPAQIAALVRPGAGQKDIDNSLFPRLPLPAGWTTKHMVCCGTHVFDPYGNTIWAQIQGSGSQEVVFSISYPDGTMPKSLCVKFQRMMWLKFDPVNKITSTTAPAACKTDISACCAGSNTSLSAYYRLRVQ